MSNGLDSSFQKVITGSIAVLNDTVDLLSPNSATTIIQILGTWSGTLVIEGSNDGSNYVTLQIFNENSRTLATSITANGSYISSTNGYQFYRIRASAWTSGTASIYGYGSDSVSNINSQSILRDSLGNLIGSSNSVLGTTDYGLIVRNIPKVRQTYSATAFNILPAANATDVFTITGSNTRTIYVHSVKVTGTRTSHQHNTIVLLKRSTANTGGTSTTRTAVPYDSTNGAATAVVLAYTANPTLGTLIGEIYSATVSLPAQSPNNAQNNGSGVVPWSWSFSAIGQPITLRGNSQVLAVNLNGVTVAGGSLQYIVEWSEE